MCVVSPIDLHLAALLTNTELWVCQYELTSQTIHSLLTTLSGYSERNETEDGESPSLPRNQCWLLQAPSLHFHSYNSKPWWQTTFLHLFLF